jgi:RNA polymerase sigma factor (sigma-70 family)
MTSLGTLADSVLIERTLAGHSECFDVLMKRHTPAVRRRVASLVRNTADQDDLVQETFLKAWRHLASFRAEASFRTWISRVATNEVLQRFRQRSGIAHTALDVNAFASQQESPLEVVVRVEACRAIRRALAELPEKYRLVLAIRDLDEISTKDTARRLRAGTAMVKSRLFRARKMLSAAILSAPSRVAGR